MKKGRNELNIVEVLKSDIRKRIVEELYDKELSITQLEEKLEINRGTLKHHLKILIDNNLLNKIVKDHWPGKPVLYSKVISEKNNKTKQYFIEILKELKNKELTEDEYMALVPFNPDDVDKDRYDAPLKMLWVQPKLIEKFIRITPEGEKFLKENTK